MFREPVWRERAACKGLSDMWFSPVREEAAASICRKYCPVVDECRVWALSDECDPRYGVAGGMTPAERKYRKEERYGKNTHY